MTAHKGSQTALHVFNEIIVQMLRKASERGALPQENIGHLIDSEVPNATALE